MILPKFHNVPFQCVDLLTPFLKCFPVSVAPLPLAQQSASYFISPIFVKPWTPPCHGLTGQRPASRMLPVFSFLINSFFLLFLELTDSSFCAFSVVVLSGFLHASLPLPLGCCVQVSRLIFELRTFWCENNH